MSTALMPTSQKTEVDACQGIIDDNDDDQNDNDDHTEFDRSHYTSSESCLTAEDPVNLIISDSTVNISLSQDTANSDFVQVAFIQC